MRSIIVAITLLLSTSAFAQTVQWTQPTQSGVAWDSGDYAYDERGNVVRIGEDAFAYDGVNRLTASTVNAYGVASSETFRYDRYGNLLQVDASFQRVSEVVPITAKRTIAIAPNANRVSQTCLDILPCQPWQYDGAGNQTALGTQVTYAWDGAGAMTELTGSTAHERYVYDANDERVVLVSLDGSQEVVRRWTWRDTSNKVVREALEHVGVNAWAEARDYVYRDGTLLASFESAAPKAERHYHVDHLGSPRLITNAGRQKVAIEAYLPFGGRAPGGDTAWIGFRDRMRFTGHERDGEGSTSRPVLDYMHARYYTPEWGRFTSVDPGEDWDPAVPQSWNLYAYTRNNPVNATDPDGRTVLSQGWSMTHKIGVGYISVGAAQNVDFTGNMSYTITVSGGVTTPGTESFQAGVTYSTEPNVEALKGLDYQAGGSLGPAGVDIGFDGKTLKPESVGLSVDPVALATGTGGVEGHAGPTYTIEVFNMRDTAKAIGKKLGTMIREFNEGVEEAKQQVKEYFDPKLVRQPPEPR